MKTILAIFLLFISLNLKAQTVLTPWDSVPGLIQGQSSMGELVVFKNKLITVIYDINESSLDAYSFDGISNWQKLNIPEFPISTGALENSGDTSLVYVHQQNGGTLVSWDGSDSCTVLTQTFRGGAQFINTGNALFFLRPYVSSNPGDTLRLIKWQNGTETQSWKILPSYSTCLVTKTNQGILIRAPYIEGAPPLNPTLGLNMYHYNGSQFQPINDNGVLGRESCSMTGGTIIRTTDYSVPSSDPNRLLQFFNGTLMQSIADPSFTGVGDLEFLKNVTYLTVGLDTSGFVYKYLTGSSFQKINPNQLFYYLSINSQGDTSYNYGGQSSLIEYKDYLYVNGAFNFVNTIPLKNGLARCKLLNNINGTPTAMNDYYTVVDTFTFQFNIKQNDSDTNGDYLYASILNSPLHGIASVNANDEIIYTPNVGYNGLDSIQYQVCDLGGACATAWVYITVNKVSSEPILQNDNYITSINNQFKMFVLNNDDLQSEPGILEINTQPSHGFASVINDSTIQYSSIQGFWGLDSLTYKVCRTYGLCDSATVIIRTNRIPTAIDDYVYLDASNTFEFAPITNDSDADGDPLITSWQNGTLPSGAMVENGSSPGLLKYTNPNLQIGEMDSIRYILEDSYLFRDTAWVYVQREGTGSLSEISQKELIIYPNPNHGTFNLQFAGEIEKIELEDILGRTVNFEWIKNENKVVIKDALPKQVYVIRITTSTGYSFLDKIIIQ